MLGYDIILPPHWESYGTSYHPRVLGNQPAVQGSITESVGAYSKSGLLWVLDVEPDVLN